MTTSHWEHFPHEADIGVRGVGTSKERAFEQAALALTAVVVDPHELTPREEVEVTCEAPDDELLLVDWLNALIFQTATRRLLFSRFEVRLDGDRLRGRAWGEPIDVARHHPAVEVKGATYTDLSVRREPEGTWVAQCVVDV
jgi:tRNA nucleotidyltransferase (CCA-adding enzyme)